MSGILSLSHSSSQSAVQSSSTGTTLTSLIKSSGIASLFNGQGVNPETKKLIDDKTIESLATFDLYQTDFSFYKIQLYARPIQDIGAHNTDNNDNNNNNKENAYKASNGYHHALLILTFGRPEPIQYILDRGEGVRFVRVNVIESELKDGHLVLIREYNNMNVSYSTMKPFIQNEAKQAYNVVSNNCLDFVYKFIDEVLKRNEWKCFNVFWKYVSKHFNRTDINHGKYNEPQNDYIKALFDKKSELQGKIHLINDKQAREEWEIGDTVLVKLKHFKGAKSWAIAKISHIDDGERNLIHVDYVEFDEEKTSEINRYHKDRIKPYIDVPLHYLDPVTNKIMRDPVQILKSGMIYDVVTVQYLQSIVKSNIDPITGVLISVGRNKPIVMRKKALQKSIKQFMNRHKIDKDLINGIEYVHNEKVWKGIWQKLYDKYDVKKQQHKIYGKSVTVLYPQNETKEEDDDDDDDDEDDDDDDDDGKEDADLLKWDSDLMFINHTSIPIITVMGPSRIGKSTLLNQILKKQSKNYEKDDDIDEIFVTSNSGNIAQTKGAWISLFGDIDEKEHKHNKDDIVLIDQIPEDDFEMWSMNDIISWLKSLNPKFTETYNELIEHIQNNEIDGKTFHKLNNLDLLINILKMDLNHANSLVNILNKRLTHKTDEIDVNKINQMYVVDMEGMSHGVTDFTKKLFEGCYAISNVVIWFDDRVMSGKFETLMKKLQKNMKNIVTSNRKPSFLYLLRNGDETTFEFEVDEEENDEYEDDFDEWINQHGSCKWFRDMNIFSSIHGYLLDSPIRPKRQRKKRGQKRNKRNASNQEKLYYKQETLNDLMQFVKSMSDKTARFANNLYILNDQINHINRNSELSIEKRIAACNSKLKWFLLNENEVKELQLKQRRETGYYVRLFSSDPSLQIKNAIITFNEDKELVKKSFIEGLVSLQKQLKYKNLNITPEFRKQLIANKDVIIKEIETREYKKRISKECWDAAKDVVVGGIAAVMAIGGVLGVVGAVVTTQMGVQIAVIAMIAGASNLLTPVPLDKIKEILEELEFYE